MSPTMLKQAEGTPGLKITKKAMDEECLDVNCIFLQTIPIKINYLFFSV